MLHRCKETAVDLPEFRIMRIDDTLSSPHKNRELQPPDFMDGLAPSAPGINREFDGPVRDYIGDFADRLFADGVKKLDAFGEMSSHRRHTHFGCLSDGAHGDVRAFVDKQLPCCGDDGVAVVCSVASHIRKYTNRNGVFHLRNETPRSV